MTVEQSRAARLAGSVTLGVTQGPAIVGRMPSTTPSAAIPDPILERQAFNHEHGRLYDALEKAAQFAELARHDDTAALLRDVRRKVASDIQAGTCEDDGVTLKRIFKEKVRVDDTQCISADSQKRIEP